MKFAAGPWEADTRAGTFRRFLEAHADLEPTAFLERVKHPHLVIGCGLDPRTWDRGIVLRVESREPSRTTVVVGRGASGDADIPLNCPTLSSRHVTFTADAGKFLVTDEGSRSGTWLDGVRLDPGKPAELASDRPTLDLGPDVRALFLAPASLQRFLADARAARPGDPPKAPPVPPVPGSEGRAEWPTYSLIQESTSKTSTARDLPAFVLPQGAGQAIEKRTIPDGGPRAPIVVPGFFGTQWDAAFGNRSRVARTAAVVLALFLILRWMGRPLLILLFASDHPNWFK